MLNAIHGVKLYAQCYTRSEAICSLLYMELSFMLNAIARLKLYAQCYTRSDDFMLISTDGVKVYAQCYTSNEAICSMLYME